MMSTSAAKYVTVGKRFGSTSYENNCLRCGCTVYQVDKVGPLKDFTFFHKGCFKCMVCGSKLTLKTYYNNQKDNEDREVYCQSHVPKTIAPKVDGFSVGIKQAVNVPKANHLVNDQIRGSGKGTFDAGALVIKSALTTPKPYSESDSGYRHRDYNKMAGKFDASALHIQHGIQATKLHKKYESPHKIHDFLDQNEQIDLEMRHREEEDELYRQFQKKRQEEESCISQQIQNEWELELERLTSRFQHELSHKKSRRSVTTDEERDLTVRLNHEKADLEKNMTIKLDRKKGSITKKLLEQERQATAELVDKHSQEMIHLINQKFEQFKQTKVGSHSMSKTTAEDMSAYPPQAPAPGPPSISKMEIYSDPSIFQDIDQVAINVAREDQQTFTDLVRLLTGPCNSDVEKARVIFRWITVKNLNTMTFDDDLTTDSPMGILRGIKQGTESYHVLFKRLCSYSGLHCVVVKGFSKSAGYQPGIKFEDNRFRNSWNAVYVANGWRFVQCNWGARHLVNAKEVPLPGSGNTPGASSKGSSSKSDSLRYEYDDHYFLTDPREFIYEFFPLQHEWQLLKNPITLREFEQLPFVRSLFFRYGLYFPDEETKAVLETDSSGASTVRIGMPTSLTPNLIFHYNLKVYDRDTDCHDGFSLKRFVMQSVQGNTVSFRVHAPSAGSFIMDIFANATTPSEYVTGEPMKFKSVSKFKMVCHTLHTVMVPLPDCASGEWGPMKGTRLFGLIPLSHEDALIFSGRHLDIQFRMSRPLTDFMASLHQNGAEEKKLTKHVSCHLEEDIISFFIQFPDDGQYGLDIYTRELNTELYSGDKQLLTHCCKYLINVGTKRSSNTNPPSGSAS